MNGVNAKVTISSDGYKAYISARPGADPSGISSPELFTLLQENGVVYGVKRDVLMLVTARLKRGENIDELLVAEGVTPVQGVSAQVEYKFEISSKPKELESGKVDYRELQKIISVKQGQVLAIKKNGIEAREGVKVTGEKIPVETIEITDVIVKDNIEVDEQEEYTNYKAACDGALRFDKRVLSVFPILRITDDVDFNVGNIHFQGEVKIGRDVLPDFVVEAKGGISVLGSAIACQLNSDGNIKIHSGIVGKNKGFVQAGGTVTATFIENARVVSGGDMTVKNGIIGSKIYCDGTLKMEMRRSRVVGCYLKAARGITLFNAGSRFDKGTVVVTGIHPTKEKEYFKMKVALDARVNEAKELEKRYGRNMLENRNISRSITAELQRDLDKWDFLKKQIKNIMNYLKATEEEMYDYSVTIRIKETLFPRVTLQIGKYKLTASKEYYDVTVRYSEEADRLVIE